MIGRLLGGGKTFSVSVKTFLDLLQVRRVVAVVVVVVVVVALVITLWSSCTSVACSDTCLRFCLPFCFWRFALDDTANSIANARMLDTFIPTHPSLHIYTRPPTNARTGIDTNIPSVRSIAQHSIHPLLPAPSCGKRCVH